MIEDQNKIHFPRDLHIDLIYKGFLLLNMSLCWGNTCFAFTQHTVSYVIPILYTIEDANTNIMLSNKKVIK